MQVFLDHLASIFVGGFVLLILLVITVGGKEDSVQRTLHQTYEEQVRTLAEVLEDDFRNAGSGIPSSQPRLIEASDTTVSVRVKEDFGESPIRTVAYRRVPTGETSIAGTEVPVFALERLVDGTTTQRFEGLSEMAFQLRDASGTPTADLAQGREVHVRLTMGLPPAKPSDLDTRARYRRSLQMPSLSN